MSLREAEGFDMSTAWVNVDDSQDYGETRYFALGFLGLHLCALVFTINNDDSIHAISLRGAEKSEEKRYAESF